MAPNKGELLHERSVDRLNREKLYIQLTRIFLDEITSGKWPLGQQIPTEDELCGQYGVSRITIRQAIGSLVSDGYLMKIQGRGTFVTSVLPVVGLAMRTTLTEEMFGKEVQLKRQILFTGIKELPSDIKVFLKTDERTYYILSKRMVKEETVYVEEAFIPVRMLPSAEKLDITHSSLYSLLQEKAAKKIFKMMQTIEISKATSEHAQYLGVRAGAPVLVVHRLFMSSDNSPIAYTKIQGISDRYKFQTEFERLR